MNNTVSIATKPLVYSAFRYLNHKAWNALAEYVDNSLQSFIDHQDILSKLNPSGKLTVRINIDLQEDRITVVDDAFGIEEHNFERAFELANIPLDASGLNEFGMGMKVSSIWFSDWWVLETSAYGENVKKKVIFDLNDVAQNEKLSLDVDIKAASRDAHFTKLTLTKLSSNNKPTGRTIGAIKKHLTSIYIKYIRNGILDLYVNDELLQPTEPKILVAPYFKTPNGDNITWRYDINFEVPKYVNGKEVGKYVAKGFIGVLETMSEIDNGLLLFRRGRVIGTSYDEKYRPKLLSGSIGSPRYKRIFGELELDGFNVSFNKSSFVEDDDFYSFIEILKDDIASHKTLDIFGQAENYRKPVSANDRKKIATNISNSLKKTTNITITKSVINVANSNSVNKPVVDNNSLLPSTVSPNENSDSSNSGTSSNTVTQTEPNDSKNNIGFDDREINVDLMGVHYTLIIGSNFNMSEGIYSFEQINSNTFRSDLNLNNPYFERFSKSFSSEDGVNSVLSFISTMLTTEISLMSKSDYTSGKQFRDSFNSFFGNI
jgi:hypothetical protein